MEILTTNTSYAAAIVLAILCIGAFSFGCWGIFSRASETPTRILSAVIAAVAFLGVGLAISDPTVVTYDAIITDWNAVYEQGYEVVETNGKIVTLRKVDE